MKVQYAYDDALRLTDITAGEPGAGGMSIHYEYSPAGQRTRKSYGSGNGAEDSAMESILKYDSTGLLSGIITDTLTLNRYLYCGANPLSYVDVMGFGYTDYVAPVTDTVEGWIRTAENRAVERLAWKENPNNDSWWYNYMCRFDCGVRQGMVQWLGDTLVSVETMALDSVAMMFDPAYTIHYTQKQICDFANSMHYMGEAIETHTIPGLISMKWDEITESPDVLGRAAGRVAPDIILAVAAKNIELEREAAAGRKVYEGGSTSVQHAVGSANQAQSVLDGINPKYFNPESRFGGGFYVGADADTIVA